jgi:hypothetical protein
LPGRLAAREPCADNVDDWSTHWKVPSEG